LLLQALRRVPKTGNLIESLLTSRYAPAAGGNGFTKAQIRWLGADEVIE
jgi:hypothetical protein